MESPAAAPPMDAPVHGYSRAALDEFVAAAAEERARLEREIASDEERTRRSRAALGAHRVMVSMLLEAQREIAEIGARADLEAAEILAASERSGAVLDLTREPPDAVSVQPVVPAAPAVAAPDTYPAGEGERADYFEFLRGALVDDEPLGPRPSPA